MAEQRLNGNKLAFSFGLVWGLGILFAGWAGWLFHYGFQFISTWGSIYLGYKPTFVGGIIGGVWGFVDFFIFIWLVIWLYNRQVK